MKSQRLGAFVSIVLLGAACVFLATRLRSIELAEVERSLRETPKWRIALAFCVTLANYSQLTLYDAIGLRYIDRSIPSLRVYFASVVAIIFAHNIGPSLLSGGSLRYRFYSAWGLSAAEVGRLVAFGIVTFLVGFCWVGGAVMVTLPPNQGFQPPLPASLVQGIGGGLVAVGGAYLVLCLSPLKELKLGGAMVRVPSGRLALSQICVAGCDWLAMACVLRLLAPMENIDYPTMLLALVTSQILAMSSQVPGGFGVFEYLLLSGLRGSASTSDIAATLLLYRTVYYFVPFAIATFALFVMESRGVLLRTRSKGRSADAAAKEP